MKVSVKIKFIIAVIVLFAAKTTMNAQRIALTSNLLEDVVLTPNIGVDVVIADRQSLTFDTSFSPYKLSPKFHNKRMAFRAGYKYWLNQAFYAHYIGFDALASSSEVGIGKHSFRDEYVGIGVGYGYSFILGKRLNIVPSIGVGVAYGQTFEGYDHMVRPGVGVEATATTGFKPILTRLAVTIQYVLK